MARRSPTVVNQTCETGCTWRMFGIFNFREGPFNRRLDSNWRHAHATAAGNESSRSSSGVLKAADEKHPHFGVTSRRRRDYGCKSISYVENAQAADQENRVTKMTIDQKFVNKNYLGKEGAGGQPEQLLDALQILYSNKELFLKLLQDPNSLLVKQIHDLQSSQVKEPYQAMEKKMTRLNKHMNSNARQCEKSFESFDRYNPSSSCEPQFSNNIVVLKTSTNDAKNFDDTRLDGPQPHSHRSFIYNAQKPSHVSLGRIKRKFRYVMRARRKEQQWRITDGVPDKFPRSCQGLQDGKNVKELDIAGRNSLTNDHANIEKRLKDSELCMRKEVASLGESCSRITNNASASFSEQNTLNIPVEGRTSQSDMLKYGIEEIKQCTNSLRRIEPLPDFESLPSLQRYCRKLGSVNEGMRYYENYQMDHRTKLGLQKEGGNCSYSSLGRKIKDSPMATVKTFSDKLHPFGTDISIRESIPGGNLRAHYDIPREPDGGYEDSPTQNFDKNNSTRGIEFFQDSRPEIQILSFSPEVASSGPSSCERIEDTINMSDRFEHPSTESVEHFTGETVINPRVTIFQAGLTAEESQVFEENHLADLIRSSLDRTKILASSNDILDCSREILQVFSLKWDEIVMKHESSDRLRDPSTFDELKGSIHQLSSDTILLDCVIETFMEVYQNCGFPLHIARKCPSVQAYVAKKVLVKEIAGVINLHFLPHPSQITLEQIVGKDLARSGSWLNIQVDTEDIVIEVEEDVLENLVLEIVSEMDVRSMNTWQ